MARPLCGRALTQTAGTKTSAFSAFPHTSLAKQAFYTVAFKPNKRDTWDHLRANLVAQFYPVETRTARTIEFQSTRYNIGETIDSYAFRLERKLEQAMPELAAAGAAQVRAEMLKSQFINGLPDPYRTRLYENPLLTFEQCQVTARQLMAAAQLSLLVKPYDCLLSRHARPTVDYFLPYAGANVAAPQIKPEPQFPANASRPYYPERDDRDRDGRRYDTRDYDDREFRREPTSRL